MEWFNYNHTSPRFGLPEVESCAETTKLRNSAKFPTKIFVEKTKFCNLQHMASMHTGTSTSSRQSTTWYGTFKYLYLCTAGYDYGCV
jgi:hypothetical protein